MGVIIKNGILYGSKSEVPDTIVEPLTVTKNGVYEAGELRAYNPVTVDVPVGGLDVSFYDYDGALVAGYTAADFAALEALPENPSHDGLVARGWNWSLDEAKAYVAKYGLLNVGQMYATDDGATRVHIHIGEGLPESRRAFTLAYTQSEAGGVTVDWGDGSDPETDAENTDQQIHTHTYAAPGDYVIRLRVTAGTLSFDSASSYASSVGIYGSRATTNAYNNVRVRRIEIGEGVPVLGKSSLAVMNGLTSITLPDTVTELGSEAFYQCRKLEALVIPSSVTAISSSALRACPSLRRLSLPNSLTDWNATSSQFYEDYALESVAFPEGTLSVGQGCFNNCYGLRRVAIPEGVTSIGTSAFFNCYALTEVALPEGLLTVGGSAFKGCASLRRLSFPDSVTSIGDSVAENAVSLASVRFPANAVTLGVTMFNGCNALAEATLPEGMTTIPRNMMTSNSLASLTVPASVTSFATKAFANMVGLGAFHFRSATPPSMSATDVFSGIADDCVMYVPADSVDAYKGGGYFWELQAGRIQAEPEA